MMLILTFHVFIPKTEVSRQEETHRLLLHYTLHMPVKKLLY